MKNKLNKDFAIDIIADIIGMFIFGVGVQSLSAPYNLPPGGVTGVAMFINYYTNLPISILVFAINAPILVLAYVMLGKKFAFNTIKTVIISSIMLEVCARFVPVYDGDVMLAALFAGLLQGIGMGIVFLRGSTTGGVDVLSRVIQIKFPHISIGKIILAIDAVVLVMTVFVYKSVANAMYALIVVFVTSKVIDSMIYGIETGRMIMIISDKQQEIYSQIHEQMGRGSTLLNGTGTYTGDPKNVLICAVSTPEFHQIKRLVYSIDRNAFIMSLETDEVLGEGFKSLEGKP